MSTAPARQGRQRREESRPRMTVTVPLRGTGHAEAIQVEFDSARLSYEALLDYFFRMHDPTTLNRQHNDVGTQYRSAIFYSNEAQKRTAESVKARWEKSGKFNRPITTEIMAE